MVSTLNLDAIVLIKSGDSYNHTHFDEKLPLSYSQLKIVWFQLLK